MRPNMNQPRQPSEFDERVLQIRRVSKKTRGGNKIGFTALVVIGDRKGRVGTGYGKALDVAGAVNKAISKARKEMVPVKMKNSTIAHEVNAKYASAKVLLRPAPKGTGVVAGGSIRTVIELAGIKDISAKMLGASNKINNVRCTIKALGKLKG
jgi:small subunit ribosomal protein S5